MWNRQALKAQGKAAFKMNYWKSVFVSFLLSILTAATTSVSMNSSSQQMAEQQAKSEQAITNLADRFQALTPQQQLGVAAVFAGGITLIIVISILLKIFVENPLLVGCHVFFKNNVMAPPANLDTLGSGFRNYGHTFITLFLKDLFLALWTMLFIVPGFVKSYSYRMVPYIIAEHPELSPTETITLSRRMMDGHKWNAFVLDLSFIGWALLTILTLGLVGIFWYEPYKYNTDAALYLAIKNEYNA